MTGPSLCRSRASCCLVRLLPRSQGRASHHSPRWLEWHRAGRCLRKPGRLPAPVTLAGCWVHARRGLFRLAELGRTPLAVEAVRRIDSLFEVERTINGAVPQQLGAPIVENLMEWMRDSCSRMSTKSPIAQAMAYILRRPDTFTAFLHDGRICLTNNATERSLRGIAVGRKVWLFAGSDRGGRRAAAMYALIVTAKLNDVDPHAWLADVIGRINDIPVSPTCYPGIGKTPDTPIIHRRPDSCLRPSSDAYRSLARLQRRPVRPRGPERHEAACSSAVVT